MTTAYSYLRFSSPAQAHGDSIRRQEAARDAWLTKNGIQLDVTLKDTGVSAHKGKHLSDKYALGRFLELAKAGRVPRDSYLIVENLDRLSREDTRPALSLFLQILEHGINIVQLEPESVYRHDKTDMLELMRAIMELSRGHSESQMKSERIGNAWGEKKRKARDGGIPHGKRVPAWLKVVRAKEVPGRRTDYSKAKYELKEDVAETVRTIFRLCVNGMGTKYIAKELNKRGVPPIGKAKKWTQTYVSRVLRSRAAIGEYQPMRKLATMARRESDGEPIPAYFPPVVTEAEWYTAQKAIESRRSRSGRPSKGPLNVFSGLVQCALDQCTMNAVLRNDKQKHLVSSKAFRGEEGSRWCTFPLVPFTEAVLKELKAELADELFTEPGTGRAAEIAAELGKVEKQLEVAKAKFLSDPETAEWQDMVSDRSKRRKELLKELAQARQEAANPLTATWAEFLKETDPRRIRAALLRTVESIHCVIAKRPTDRICVAQVRFQGNDQVRSYIITWQQGRGGCVPTQPGKYDHWSWVDAPSFDLRDPADAKLIESMATLTLHLPKSLTS